MPDDLSADPRAGAGVGTGDGATSPKAARRTARRHLRREIARARNSGSDEAALAERAVDLVRRLGLDSGSTVASYLSRRSEPPTAATNAALIARGIRVLVPVTEPDLDLDWADAADPGRERLGRDAVAAADLVLAPGLAVDAAGARLGQGGGSYDRALPRRRAGVPVVVLLHPGEFLDREDAVLPREAHDVPVDAVLTVDGIRWIDDVRWIDGLPTPR